MLRPSLGRAPSTSNGLLGGIIRGETRNKVVNWAVVKTIEHDREKTKGISPMELDHTTKAEEGEKDEGIQDEWEKQVSA